MTLYPHYTIKSGWNHMKSPDLFVSIFSLTPFPQKRRWIWNVPASHIMCDYWRLRQITLWLCQYTYGTWPSMMDFSVEHGGSSIVMWVSQRIKHHEIPWNQHVPIVFPWFFAEIHIIFKENFTWPGALQSGRWVFDLWHRASCSAASCAAVAGGAQWCVGVSKVKRWLNNHQNDLKCLSQCKWC